jgi:hypothetical protein
MEENPPALSSSHHIRHTEQRGPPHDAVTYTQHKSPISQCQEHKEEKKFTDGLEEGKPS